MRLFKFTSKEHSAEPTPLELLTNLSVCLHLADGQADFMEREAWSESLRELFPNHTPAHALEILTSAHREIHPLTYDEKVQYAFKLAQALKAHYTTGELESKIIPNMQAQIEADGIVLTSESDMIRTIESALGSSLRPSDPK